MPAHNPGTAVTRDPSVNDPRIGHALRGFREGRGLLGDNVAHALKWSSSKVSRYERTRSAVSRKELTVILRYYQERHGMPPGQATAILAMFDQALEMSGFMHPYLGPAVLASTVREWSARYVPRLLQTRPYAMAVLRDLQFATGMSPGEIRDATAALARWQTRLTDNPPVRVRALLDEAVLCRLAGDAEVMREQLAHLDRVTTATGTDIEIRVLPFAAGGVPRWTSEFSYLEYPVVAGADESPEVVTEELDGPGQPVLSERDVWRRHQLFTALWQAGEPAGPAVKRALAGTWAV
jgi:hypothetical protein